MLPIEKLKHAAGLLQELYYDLENENLPEEITNNLSISEDLIWCSINYMESKKNA